MQLRQTFLHFSTKVVSATWQIYLFWKASFVAARWGCKVDGICPHCSKCKTTGWEKAHLGGGLARGRGGNDVEAEGTKLGWILSQKSKLTQAYASICYATKAILCRRTNGSCWRLARHQADMAWNAHGQAYAWHVLLIVQTVMNNKTFDMRVVWAKEEEETGCLKKKISGETHVETRVFQS